MNLHDVLVTDTTDAQRSVAPPSSAAASSSAIAAAISFDCDCDCDDERGLFGKVENCQDFER